MNKPEGVTSHDVVLHIRRIFRTRKVGHAGTLDPFATGVLPVCLNRATRIAEYLMRQPKTYCAVMKLGEETTTQDCTGDVIRQQAVPPFSDEDLSQVLEDFIGEIEQIPPMFSAKRVQGKRLYEFARAGKTIERDPRTVRIDSLDMLEQNLPEIQFRVRCAKGTYIRTLAHDIGQRLGCGAHLTALTRTHIGTFSLDDAVDMTQLESQTGTLALNEAVMTLDEALAFLPAILLQPPKANLLAHGTRLNLAETDFRITSSTAHFPGEEGLLRVYNAERKFIALARGERIAQTGEKTWMFQPVKVFFTDPPAGRS